jgi:hypothetical protein
LCFSVSVIGCRPRVGQKPPAVSTQNAARPPSSPEGDLVFERTKPRSTNALRFQGPGFRSRYRLHGYVCQSFWRHFYNDVAKQLQGPKLLLLLKIRRRWYQQRSSSYLRGEGLSEQARAMVRAFTMSPTIAECLEHAHYCEWYAGQTTDEVDRKFVLRKAMVWRMLAMKSRKQGPLRRLLPSRATQSTTTRRLVLIFKCAVLAAAGAAIASQLIS